MPKRKIAGFVDRMKKCKELKDNLEELQVKFLQGKLYNIIWIDNKNLYVVLIIANDRKKMSTAYKFIQEMI